MIESPTAPGGAGNPDAYNYKSYKVNPNFIRFNPPLNRFASGAYVDSKQREQPPRSDATDPGRTVILGTNSYAGRLLDKGVIYQDDSTVKNEDGDNAYSVSNTNYKDFQTLGNERYGFRFHYNPSTIDYSATANGSTMDPGLILSGTTSRAMPIHTDSPSTISFSVIINRIEDLTMLQGGGEAASRVDGSMRYYYGRNMTDEEIRGILERGTGYDMEFLFRTLLGRPYETDLRGTTADVGIVFGLPVILDFSPRNLSMAKERQPNGPGTGGTTSTFGSSPAQHGLRYWGRVSSISYTHREFSRDMVPMFTELFITFERYPDAKGKQNTSTNADIVPVDQSSAASGIVTATAQGLAYVRASVPDYFRISLNILYDVSTGQFINIEEPANNWVAGTLGTAGVVVIDAPDYIFDKWNNGPGGGQE